ncbi:HD-GYP domain-containing protein [Balneatrix alpica]|uniref:HD-GYP domain-containing protein n=1 Tax=Balneatrix alpica TaxID=75684 RepID=UPI00273836DF|nr:HD domain-containing phosphohydrolase [Balneatrix alpica]
MSPASICHALALSLGYRDALTRAHADRVVLLCDALAHHCQLSQTEINILLLAAQLHDLGKIGIADAILQKPGALNTEEWALMQQHSAIGAEIITVTAFPRAEQVAQCVRHHHEHFDGSGYPDRLQGQQIPLLARILTIADSYDAMAVTRAYHPARSHLHIMAIMEEETGTKFDPALMSVFCPLIHHSPLKSAC